MEVRIEGLRFARNGRFLLDIPSLQLHGGRITALLGPNGSGKTTLLRLIAGLERPSAGQILLDRTAVVPGGGHWRDIAYAFQEPVMLQRTVGANLRLALSLRGVSPVDAGTRAAAAARRLGIDHLLDRPADRLSGGEAQRANLARALALAAPLALLDEPLSGLDPSSRARLIDELPALVRAASATAVIVTHDRDEALRLADDLVVLVAGRVRVAGPKRQALEAPPDAEVAELLGYQVIDLGDARLAVPPEGLLPAAGPGSMTLTVETVVDLLDRREAIGRIGPSRVRLRLPVDVPAPAPGDRVVVTVRHAHRLP